MGKVNWKRLAWFLGTVLGIALTIALVNMLPGCGTQPQKKVVVPIPPTPATCDGGASQGATKLLACPVGQSGVHTQECQNGAWTDVSNTCAVVQTGPGPTTCSKTTFADVQPLVQTYCAGCHAGWTTYAGAKPEAAKAAKRVALPMNDQQHMPQNGGQPPHPQLCGTPDDPSKPTECPTEEVFVKWNADGALESCPDHQTPPPAHATITQPKITAAAFADAGNLLAGDQKFIRYASIAEGINDGLSAAQLQTFVDALNKGLNSLNTTTQDLKPLKLVDASTGLFRWDIRDYGMSLQQIAALDKADVNVPNIDNTSQGKLLQSLLGDQRTVWDATNLLDVAFRNASVYYGFTKIPPKLVDYQRNIGVDFQNDLATLPTGQVSFIGNIGQITLQKNRLIVHDSQARSSGPSGSYYQTFDVNQNPHQTQVVINGNQLVNIDTKNLDQAPLLPGTGARTGNNITSLENFTQDASETIAVSMNGTIAFGLWDAKGNRLDAADPNVVQDNQVSIGNHVITTGNTCSRCHNEGFISMADSVLAFASGSDQLDANDVKLVKAVYRNAETNSKLFADDNAAYKNMLKQLGISQTADPQAQLSDRILGNWTLSQLAAYLKISTDDLKTCINSSSRTKSAINPILQGQTVPFATIAGNVFAGLVSDCQINQDPISQ